MPAQKVPEVVIYRIPLYIRSLVLLEKEKITTISSLELARRLQLTSAQVRKDLSYFGRFGKQGKGYDVRNLLNELKNILNLNRVWNMALIGVGTLGRAIVNYEGFLPNGFRIVSAFDINPEQVGKKVGNLQVEHINNLQNSIKEKDIQIGIIAVPPAKAQEVIDLLTANGIKTILNYAPASVRIKPGIIVRSIDPVLSLQSMTYYLKIQ